MAEQPRSQESIVEEARSIAREIKQSYQGLIDMINELKTKNTFFNLGLDEYGGMETFEDFQFQCFDTAATGMGKERLISSFDTDLEKYIEGNKDRTISTDQLNLIKQTFEDRKIKIVQALFKEFTNQEEAFQEIQRVSKELIHPSLNTEKVFS